MEKKNEISYFKVGVRGRRIIVCAISNEELLLYKINKGTNNAESFLLFLENFYKLLKIKKFKIH